VLTLHDMSPQERVSEMRYYMKFALITIHSYWNQLVFMGCHCSSFADHP
jgi:hypothetical protein